MKGSEEKFVFFMKGSDRHFIIPVYQRNYDWRLENCKQLYNDLVKIIKKDLSSHFFGSLVSAGGISSSLIPHKPTAIASAAVTSSDGV